MRAKTILTVLFLFSLAVAGFVIYGISYLVRKRQGIVLGAAFKEIPPE